MKTQFRVGDRVMITPAYWKQLSKSQHASQDYLDRGGDFIYTVSDVTTPNGRPCVWLAEADGSWPDAYKYLMHVPLVVEDADFEMGEIL